MEELSIYRNKKVFVTGHTGFKGSWLIASLKFLGCEVFGFAQEPEEFPNHYSLLNCNVQECFGDIRDYSLLQKSIHESQAEIVFHLAAQSLVRRSFQQPLHTYEVNVMGSLNLLKAASSCSTVRSIVMVTTDKVYANKEAKYAYSESDLLGGYDMYSSSKACCELMIDSFRNSFINISDYGKKHNVLVVSVRSGNVIGGGDWGRDRLIPDLIRSFELKEPVEIRHPNSIRPWQHVLDCNYAYLVLGSQLFQGNSSFSGAWNVAPDDSEVFTVRQVLEIAHSNWNKLSYTIIDPVDHPHEANILMLSNKKIKANTGWKSRYTTEQSITLTVDWYKSYFESNKIITQNQIENYFEK